MKDLGFAAGQVVDVRSDYGQVRGRLFPAPIQRQCLQMHWPEANVLISSAHKDRGGLVPDYNAVVGLHPAKD